MENFASHYDFESEAMKTSTDDCEDDSKAIDEASGIQV